MERCSLSVGDKLKGTISGDFKIARSAVIRAPQQRLQRSAIELSVGCAHALWVQRAKCEQPLSLLSLALGVSLQLFTLQRPHWNVKTITSFSPKCSVGKDTEGQAT